MGREADRQVRADPPMGGGVYFLTNLRFSGGLFPHGNGAGQFADSGATVSPNGDRLRLFGSHPLPGTKPASQALSVRAKCKGFSLGHPSAGGNGQRDNFQTGHGADGVVCPERLRFAPRRLRGDSP
jgi:hypothetical protein